ncbi:MAG: GTPase ObgE [Bdellovibrionia bacterium]
MKFIDEVKIYAHAGHGGRGGLSFYRAKFTPRGGPDGGDGGKGGDLIFRVNQNLSSLLDLKYKKEYRAEDGHPGTGQHSSGLAGVDLVIDLPEGTLIKDENGNLVADMSGELQEFVCFEGGRGGKGNAFFKSSINQAPTHYQPGEDGGSGFLQLELKLLADVGIIGYPNAGKSTLISRMSSARPKVADYPFTTLVPNLGVVSMGEGINYVVADIPGLIPGAHQGTGLGTRFLRHIERTKCFIHLIDASEFSAREPVQDFKDINYELEMYDQMNADKADFAPLHNRPQWVVLNKIDVTPESRIRELTAEFTKMGVKVIQVSAVCGHGIKELIYEVGRFVLENKSKAEDRDIRREFQPSSHGAHQ